MSHPVPGQDYSDKHNQETEKQYAMRKKKGEALANKKKKEEGPYRIKKGVLEIRLNNTKDK